jgi:hypothetical protein
VLYCEFCSLTDLLDNQETRLSLDHTLEVGLLVSRNDKEAQGVLANQLVLLLPELKGLSTVIAAALADKAN